MKILFIANGNGLSDKIGGSIIRAISIAKAIQKQGHEVSFLTTIGGFNACKRSGLTAVYYVLPASLWTTHERGFVDRLLAYIISTIGSLAKIHQLPSGDIVITESDYFCDTIPAALYKAKFKRSCWVASTYHFIPPPSKRQGGFRLPNIISYLFQQFSLRIIALNADKISTETEYIRSELIWNLNISREKVIAVQSGIEPNAIDHISVGIEKEYDACYLGGLRRSKGIFDLVHVWKKVCSQRETAKLAVAGVSSSASATEVNNEIKKLGLEGNIDILGFLSEEEKYRLFKKSRLYVLPSYEEGIPITFYEAMYCNLPIITYFLPPYTEIKDYLISIPLGDRERMSQEILRLLADESLYSRFVTAGKDFARLHTWDTIASYLLSKIASK